MKINQPTTGGSSGGGSIPGTITGGTDGSVLFIHPTNTLAQDNAQFYLQDSATIPQALATNTNVAHSINVSGDFTGTDAVNIYGQMDSFLLNSQITNSLAGLNTDGAIPGYTTSSSRGTAASLVQLNANDTVGGFFGWGTVGASPSYQNLGGMLVSTSGATANNLGGTLSFLTKSNNGALVARITTDSGANTNVIGSLGVNMATPGTQFHLRGDSQYLNTADNAQFWITGLSNGNDKMYFGVNTTGTPFGYFQATESGVAVRNIAINPSGGNVGIGSAVTAPTAHLQITAGTAGASSAPLKFTSGTNQSTAEAGAMEYDGTQLYFSPSTTRNIVAQVSGSTAFTAGSIPFAATSGYLAQNNGKLFWDNTNFRLGVGNAVPLDPLDIVSATAANVRLRATSASGFSGVNMYDDSNTLTGSFQIGNTTVAGGLAGNMFLGARKTGGQLLFVMGAGATEMARFDASGNLSVGSTTATSMFNVGTANQFQVTGAGNVTTSGNLSLSTAGSKLSIATGANASVGTATLSGGTVTVATTAVTASSKIFLTDATTGALTNIGTPTVGTVVAGTSFVINSSNVLDTSNINWLIIN